MIEFRNDTGTVWVFSYTDYCGAAAEITVGPGATLWTVVGTDIHSAASAALTEVVP